MAGVEAETILMCTATNTTYTDCPISADFRGKFVVSVHNPAAVTQEVLKLKLPPADFTVEVFDGEWTTVDSTLHCYDYMENTWVEKATETCDLFVKSATLAQSITHLKVKMQDRTEEKVVNE